MNIFHGGMKENLKPFFLSPCITTTRNTEDFCDRLGTVAHACNPSTWEAKVGRSFEVRSSRPAWLTWQNPIYIKNTKIYQVWWRAPVIQAT